MSRRLCSKVVAGTSSDSEFECFPPPLLEEKNKRQVHYDLVSWLATYQLQDEDVALQKALSLSQVIYLKNFLHIF